MANDGGALAPGQPVYTVTVNGRQSIVKPHPCLTPTLEPPKFDLASYIANYSGRLPRKPFPPAVG